MNEMNDIGSINRREKKTVDATESAAADWRRMGRLQDRQSEADWRFRVRFGRRRLHYEGEFLYFYLLGFCCLENKM
ncbi:hypothetical protein LINPERPRIM_LOCUS11231, partial [Linum perenne]